MLLAESPPLSVDMYMLVDDIPALASARLAVRQEAEHTLEGRRLAQQLGMAAMAPPIDALSTAVAVLEAGDQVSRQERYEGLVLDCERLVAEWYRKNTSEYFPAVRHYYDVASGDYFSHGLSIRKMTENALLPIAGSPEEEGRRINERVEDATPALIRGLGAAALRSATIRTLSECSDEAIAAYHSDRESGAQHRGYGGYVPEIEKLMIRDIRLDPITGDRFEEQVGLPGIYINHSIVQLALERCGAHVDGMDKTRLHGSQLLVNDDIMDFVALLDEVASRQWCTNIFMGEVVESGFVKDYEAFRQEALLRQAGLREVSQTVANFVLSLAEDGIDGQEAPKLVRSFLKELLLEVAKQDRQIALQMFDERTADGLQEVRQLEADGLFEAAFTKMQEVEAAAPGGGYCGDGCGINDVDAYSSSGRELAKLLRAKSGDKLAEDKVRACRCGARSIVYAYSASKVNKYCLACKAFESKTSAVPAKANLALAA